MRGLRHIFQSVLIFNSLLAIAEEPSKKEPKNPQPCERPLTRKDDIVHKDPYRWLEKKSEERDAWVFSQTQSSEKLLDQMPIRGAVRDFMWKLNEESQDISSRDLGNGYEVVLVDRGLRAANEVVLRKNGVEIRRLFSTDKVATDGSANLSKFYLDPLKHRVLIPVTHNGSIDVADLHIVNIETGLVEEVLEEIGDYGITWVGAREFTYHKYADRDGVQLNHTLGDARGDRVSKDSEDRRSNDSRNRYLLTVAGDSTIIRAITGSLESKVDFKVESVVAENDNFLFVTRVRSDQWSEVVQVSKNVSATGQVSFHHSQIIEMPERGRFVGAYASAGTALLTYRLGEKYWALILDSRGVVTKRVELPEGCNIVGFRLLSVAQAEITLSSAVQKGLKFNFDLVKGTFQDPELSTKMMTDSAGTLYVHKIIQAKSADGKTFPIRVTHKSGMKMDGNNPSLVEGYGGFGVPGYFDPYYNVMNYHFLRLGGVHVAPALRGGNELGPEFRNDAKLEGKQKTFDDMIATLERINALKISSPDKIAAMGWSNGGLLIGALITQRPELLKVAIPGNGVQDMLRKRELDPRFDNGWEYEYGSPDDPEDFKFLLAYSPVHNGKNRAYPLTLIIAGLQDSRVNVAHSFKLAAVLQAAQRGENPVILFSVPQAGHWASKAALQDLRAIETMTAIWTTIYDGLGLLFTAPEPEVKK